MRLTLIAAALGASFSVAAAEETTNWDPGFEGTWVGTLKLIDPDLYNPVRTPREDKVTANKTMEVAIEVKGETVRVLLKDDSGWEEVKPGAFALASHRTNAIVATIDSSLALDRSSGWVETWNFTLTHKNDDTLYAYWVRAVNNYNVPEESHPAARFFMSRFGEIARSEPVPEAGRLTVSGARPRGFCAPEELWCGAGAE